jgi:hypothetical protein
VVEEAPDSRVVQRWKLLFQTEANIEVFRLLSGLGLVHRLEPTEGKCLRHTMERAEAAWASLTHCDGVFPESAPK